MVAHHRRNVNNPFATSSRRTVGYSDPRYKNNNKDHNQKGHRRQNPFRLAGCCCFLVFFILTMRSFSVYDEEPALSELNKSKKLAKETTSKPIAKSYVDDPKQSNSEDKRQSLKSLSNRMPEIDLELPGGGKDESPDSAGGDHGSPDSGGEDHGRPDPGDGASGSGDFGGFGGGGLFPSNDSKDSESDHRGKHLQSNGGGDSDEFNHLLNGSEDPMLKSEQNPAFQENSQKEGEIYKIGRSIAKPDELEEGFGLLGSKGTFKENEEREKKKELDFWNRTQEEVNSNPRNGLLGVTGSIEKTDEEKTMEQNSNLVSDTVVSRDNLKEVKDASGNVYYMDMKTKQIVWDLPNATNIDGDSSIEKVETPTNFSTSMNSTALSDDTASISDISANVTNGMENVTKATSSEEKSQLSTAVAGTEDLGVITRKNVTDEETDTLNKTTTVDPTANGTKTVSKNATEGRKQNPESLLKEEDGKDMSLNKTVTNTSMADASDLDAKTTSEKVTNATTAEEEVPVNATTSNTTTTIEEISGVISGDNIKTSNKTEAEDIAFPDSDVRSNMTNNSTNTLSNSTEASKSETATDKSEKGSDKTSTNSTETSEVQTTINKSEKGSDKTSTNSTETSKSTKTTDNSDKQSGAMIASTNSTETSKSEKATDNSDKQSDATNASTNSTETSKSKTATDNSEKGSDATNASTNSTETSKSETTTDKSDKQSDATNAIKMGTDNDVSKKEIGAIKLSEGGNLRGSTQK